MTEACVAVTRGGVTYRVPKSELQRSPTAASWLSRVAEPHAAQNGNAEPALVVGLEVLSRLRNRLDFADQDDLRAGALLVVLCAGVRKNELVGLDVGDVSEVNGGLHLQIRRSRPGSRVKERSVLLGGDGSSLLRLYWLGERLAQHAHNAPLFWTLGRHGRCRRTRITGHAVNYWLEQLRRRAGFEQRLTTRSLRRSAPTLGLRGAIALIG